MRLRLRPEIVEPLGVQTAFHVTPAKAETQCRLGPRFRGDDGVVCDACEPSGVCYIVPRNWPDLRCAPSHPESNETMVRFTRNGPADNPIDNWR